MSWWTCINGAGKYLLGPRRSDGGQIAVASKCAACPKMRKYRMDDLRGVCGLLVRFFLADHAPLTGWCGAPGKDTGDTCGCLVLCEAGAGQVPHAEVTVGGKPVRMIAAGKATVGTEACPSGRWTTEPPLPTA